MEIEDLTYFVPMDSRGDEADAYRSGRGLKPTSTDIRRIYIESRIIAAGKMRGSDASHGWEISHISAEILYDEILSAIRHAHAIREIKCATLVGMLQYMLAKTNDITVVLDLNNRKGRKIGDLIVSAYSCEDDD